MCSLDEELEQLAVLAQQHPDQSPQRQSALQRLINGILQSGKLAYPQSGCFAGQYQEIRDEAVQDLLLYVCKNIDSYNPERATVLRWVNMLLSRRFFPEAIPKVLGSPHFQRVTLADLESLPNSENSSSLTEIIKTYIESDPDHLLKREHLQNNPEINFQVLALKRLTGKSWRNISAEFDQKVSTLSAFYARSLKKFAKQLRMYCHEQEI